MNRRASPTDAPITIDGAQPTISAFEWNSGIATYPMSSGPRSMIIAIRLPVTMRRRCEQITAFGDPEVPDVNTRAQRVDGSCASPGSSVPTVQTRDVEVGVTSGTCPGRSPVDKRCDTRTGRPREIQPGEVIEVAGFGDDEIDIGMGDVAQQMLTDAASG